MYERKADFMKCRDCFLRYVCDEQTEFICKSNDYCKFIADKEKANAHWEAYYVCSNCGEHSRTVKPECPFCHAKMNGKGV